MKNLTISSFAKLAALSLLAAPALLAASTQGSAFFDAGTGSSPVEAAYTQLIGATATTADGVVLTITGAAPNSRDRGAVTDPDSDILRDFCFFNEATVVTFTRSNLVPNTEYNRTAWAYDYNSGNNAKVVDWSALDNGNGGGGNIVHTTDSSDPASGRFEIPAFITDANGTAVITAETTTGNVGGSVVVWNGFSVTPVPAPSTGTIIMISSTGGWGLLFCALISLKQLRRGHGEQDRPASKHYAGTSL